MSKEHPGINDFFGSNQARPSHPDFWRLSEIVLGLDAAMQDAMRDASLDVDDVISKEAARIGDSYSIVYMALQRAMRIHGVVTGRDLSNNAEAVSRTAVVYMEGMIVGARLEQSRTTSGA